MRMHTHISAVRLYCAIHIGSCWKMQDKRQINFKTENAQTKHNPEKANNAKT